MDEDQNFETFLREWAKERIWPTDDALLQHFLAKARAIELIQLAVARGFRDELMETQRKYGSLQAYVKHLPKKRTSLPPGFRITIDVPEGTAESTRRSIPEVVSKLTRHLQHVRRIPGP